MDQVK
jgi:hypothetical protein